MFVGVLQTTKNLFSFLKLVNLLYPAKAGSAKYCRILSKSINLEDVIDKELIDSDNYDIDNKTLDLKLNSLPSPKLPNPNNSNNKHILEKLESIQAEVKFIGIK